MVYQLNCDCHERIGIEIRSIQQFEELKSFFETQVSKGIFREVPVKFPYYIGISYNEKSPLRWYADRWYRCLSCGCLWEFIDPDFPSSGRIRKFADGVHKIRHYGDDD